MHLHVHQYLFIQYLWIHFNITKPNSLLLISATSYFLGTIIYLILFGRISDYIGRRITIIFTLILSIIGNLIFLSLNSEIIFLTGRFIQGFSCGLASSCITAYIVDINHNQTQSSIIVNSSTIIGPVIGCFGSSILVELNSSFIYLKFIILIILLILCSILIYFGKETIYYKKRHNIVFKTWN